MVASIAQPGAMHSHILNDQPGFSFMHVRGNDDVKFANGGGGRGLR
jgi:hypothetical protein